MKIQQKKEIKIKTIGELKQMIHDAHSELISLQLEKTQNKLKNTRSIFLKRKEIAYILTILKLKEFEHEENI